jgi:hypothetical protein
MMHPKAKIKTAYTMSTTSVENPQLVEHDSNTS